MTSTVMSALTMLGLILNFDDFRSHHYRHEIHDMNPDLVFVSNSHKTQYGSDIIW